jgi:hypothetical protein
LLYQTLQNKAIQILENIRKSIRNNVDTKIYGNFSPTLESENVNKTGDLGCFFNMAVHQPGRRRPVATTVGPALGKDAGLSGAKVPLIAAALRNTSSGLSVTR